MRKELDEALCAKYPRIFRDRHAPITQTAMCWGFDCGDGWYTILDALCSRIQHHINDTRWRRLDALRYNRALDRACRGDKTALLKYYGYGKDEKWNEWAEKQVEVALADPEPQCKQVPKACPQVVATQVKEKYGTLRFYTMGGDEVTWAMESLAESMSARMCEVCGAPGKTLAGGWIRTLCKIHADEMGYDYDYKEEED